MSTELPTFDCGALYDALDGERQERGLGWYELADQLWEQSEVLNDLRPQDHSLCGGAVPRFGERGDISCQYAMFMLRWLGRPPEDFLSGPVVDVGEVDLPSAGPDKRLRWDLAALHAELNARREELGLSWSGLAEEFDCSPSRLTNLKKARVADMDLVMRVTQWLRRPSAAYIHPADW